MQPDHMLAGRPAPTWQLVWWAARRASRGYLKTAELAAMSYIGDSPLFLLDYLLRLLRVAVLLGIWHELLASRAGQTGIAGLDGAAVLTYTLIAAVFAEPLAGRTELKTSLWDGTIANRLTRPMGIVGQFAAESIGRWSLNLALFSLSLLLAAPLLGVNPAPASLLAGALFVPSLALAITVGLAVEFIFGALMAIAEQNIWLIENLRSALETLLTGALLPLAVLPWGLGDIFGWLPFAAMASAPLRIYTASGEALPLLALQAGWAIVLWVLAGWLWTAHREKLASYGG